MQFKITSLLSTILFTALIIITSAASAEDIESLIGQPGVYTLTNLHPDENRAKLFSVNFQQPGLIPLCTEVEILKVKNKRIDFKVKQTGKEYKYVNHKTAGEDLKTNAARYFGKECNKDKVAK